MLFTVRIVPLIFCFFLLNLTGNSQHTGPSNKASKLPIHANLFASARLNDDRCIDTSVRLHYLEDSFHIVPHSITKTSDGNILIPGWRLKSYTPRYLNGHLVKVTPRGDTLWVREFQVTNPPFNSFSLDRAFELSDGSIIVVGQFYVKLDINYKHDLIMIKLTANGDFLWQRTFTSHE